jgi:hypothetical protein
MNDIGLNPDAALLTAGSWPTPQEPAAQEPARVPAHPNCGPRADEIMRECRQIELEPDLESAGAFLQIFGDDVLLCHKRPDVGGMGGLRGANALKLALGQNLRGHAIYFSLNVVRPGVAKKAAKTDIAAIQGVAADIDWDREKYHGRFEDGLKEIEAKLQGLMEMDAPPSVIILTGGGVQPIWLLVEPLEVTHDDDKPCAVTARVEALGRGIAQRWGGDPVQNIDRILRVPWMINHPKKDKRDAGQTTQLAAVVHPPTVHRYSLEQLEQAWRAASAAAACGSAPMAALAEIVTKAASRRELVEAHALGLYQQCRTGGSSPPAASSSSSPRAAAHSEHVQASKLRRFIELGHTCGRDGVDLIRRARAIHAEICHSSVGDRLKYSSTYSALVAVARVL